MTKQAHVGSRKASLKRRILALQLLSLMASPAVMNRIDAAIPQQNPSSLGSEISVPSPKLSPTKRNDGNDGNVGGTASDDAPSPTTDEDADALLDQSLAPTPIPDSVGLDAPSFNLSTGLAASSLGATRGSQSAAPAMMGDFFGGSFFFDSGDAITVALAGGDRRYKIAENVSPMPQNRVYFNYNHFHNALTDITGTQYSLDRFAFGTEKTFGDGMFSADVRLPFSSALNSTYDFDNPVPQATELGNLGFSLKGLLLATDTWLVSGGTTLVLPTGDDYRQQSGGTDVFVIKNDAVHMAPYLGFLATPNERWFLQGFLQTDFDLNGNEVISGGTSEGMIQDQNLMFVDVSMGRWLTRRRGASRRTLGIAAIGELHYTTTINDSDFVIGLGNSFANMDILNATMGLHLQYGKAALRVGAAAPLRDGEEKLFDAEVFVQASRAI